MVSRDIFFMKPAFCICENKNPDQLSSNSAFDLRLCFRNIDSTIPLLRKSEISSLQPSSVVVQPDLCRSWMETLETSFLMKQLIYEPRCEKTGLRGFRPGPTQTRLYNHIRLLEA